MCPNNKKKVCKELKEEYLLIPIVASLYLFNNFFLKKVTYGLLKVFFVGYFNDLICPLFFVSYVNIMLNFVNKRIVKLFSILLLCFSCGLVWEFVAPLVKENSVTDIWDLVCYCVGGVLYWIIKKITCAKKTGVKNEGT